MTVINTLPVTNELVVDGNRFVVMDAEDWEPLVEMLEDLEDQEAAREALAELSAAGGDPQKAGWLHWDDVKDEL